MRIKTLYITMSSLSLSHSSEVFVCFFQPCDRKSSNVFQSLDSTTESTLTDVTDVSGSGCYRCKDTIADLRAQLAKLSLLAEEQSRIQLEVYLVQPGGGLPSLCLVLYHSRQPSCTPSAPGPWPSRGCPPSYSPWRWSWWAGSVELRRSQRFLFMQ